MWDNFAQYGLAGAVMAGVFMVVITPMLRALIKQVGTGNQHIEGMIAEVAAQRKEREASCERHMRHDDENLAALREITITLKKKNGG